MRTVSTRDLRANLSSELSDLPFLLTKHGMVIACVHNIWNEGGSGKESPISVHKAEGKCVHNEGKGTQSVNLSVYNLGKDKLNRSQSDWRDGIDDVPETHKRLAPANPSDFFNPNPKKGKK